MKVIVVDDEIMALKDIISLLEDIPNIVSIQGFNKVSEALKYVANNTVNIAFLDINMREMNGLNLAKKIKETSPDTRIVFVTGYSNYAVEAFKLKVHGYLMKPVSAEDLIEEINTLPVPNKIQDKGIWIHTFGNFEIYAFGKIIHFSRAKPKELLAYLVDRRGASATIAEIAAVLWEDKPYNRYLQNQTQKTITYMMSTLKKYGVEDIIIRKYNCIALNISNLSCDYYDFLEGDVDAINQYLGEYMANYSWGEFVASTLDEMY